MDVEILQLSLAKVYPIIIEENFQRVVLQFPDEYLNVSILIYELFVSNLPDSVDVFITADSTYGSSIDDVSALHVEGDLLIYFGSDLSSASGSMPVMVIPIPKEIDISACATRFLAEYESYESDAVNILLTYDPCYVTYLEMITSNLFTSRPTLKEKISIAQLPHCADLEKWGKYGKDSSDYEKIGGLIVSKALLLSNDDLCIWHIGERKDQIINIMLFLSKNKMVIYHPNSNNIDVIRGDQSR
jgi:diphthamide biosynthesis enzyme Dph1/Dph2-like protein